MTETELQRCAAILTAGMIARDHETSMTAEDVVKLMDEVAAALRNAKNMPKIGNDFEM